MNSALLDQIDTPYSVAPKDALWETVTVVLMMSSNFLNTNNTSNLLN